MMERGGGGLRSADPFLCVGRGYVAARSRSG